MDKNPTISTVINKTADVGSEDAFRTFQYEVLAGKSDLNVEVKEEECVFRFDYSKVYWNSRLNTEHKRIVHMFQPGDAVCDVMAGVGPFAIPAGKKKVFVWANDLNPESYKSLEDNIQRNKVSKIYVDIFLPTRQYEILSLMFPNFSLSDFSLVHVAQSLGRFHDLYVLSVRMVTLSSAPLLWICSKSTKLSKSLPRPAAPLLYPCHQRKSCNSPKPSNTTS